MSTLGDVGRRQLAAVLVLAGLVLGGWAALTVVGADGHLIALALINGGGLLVVAMMLLEQGRRSNRDLKRWLEHTTAIMDRASRDRAHDHDVVESLRELRTILDAHGERQATQLDAHSERWSADLDAHEERVLRYLDALHARLELQRFRGTQAPAIRSRQWDT